MIINRLPAKIDQVFRLLCRPLDPASICVSSAKTRQVTAYQEALQAAGIETCLLASRSGADNDGPGVRLVTMHRIKGLEFAHVLVAGANAGDLPPFPLETADSYDLLHVAATRARDTLTITGNGRLSPFLREGG
jgi:superfamily I DNA/RNA helicase